MCSQAVFQDDEASQRYLQGLYGPFTSASPAKSEEQARFYAQNVCLAYGECHFYSVKKMLKKMRLAPQDRFGDLGSGRGKFALQVFAQSACSEVLGLEYAAHYVQEALKAADEMQNKFPELWHGRTLAFKTGNFLEVDWQGLTVVYSCSTCFTDALLDEIARKVNETPSIRQVLSLRPLSGLQRLKCRDIFTVECSWDSALCYQYVR